MLRRRFAAGLAAALAGAAAADPARALRPGVGGPDLPGHGPVILWPDAHAAPVALRRLWWLDGGRALALDLAGDQPMFSEDRLDLGALPGADLVFRPVLRRRLAGAEPVAEVVLHRRALVLRPTGRAAPPDRVLIAHRATGWEPPGRLRPATPPAAGLPAGAPPVGRAFRTGEGAPGGAVLVVLVRPLGLPGLEA